MVRLYANLHLTLLCPRLLSLSVKYFAHEMLVLLQIVYKRVRDKREDKHE
jgi:hypothetical protein